LYADSVGWICEWNSSKLRRSPATYPVTWTTTNIGRSGGLRVIYYHFAADHQIWLMTLYGKNEAADLTPGEKKALKAAIESECKARETARRKR
jgi:hypothetical protein